MKILISTDTYYPQVNGASYFTQRLAYNLQAHGHEVVVIAPSESLKNSDTIINTVRVFGIHSYPLFFYQKFRFCFPFSKSDIQKIIDDFKPDIVHIQGHFSISRVVIGVAKGKNIPVVATNHFMPENLIHYIPLHSIIGAPIIKLAWKDFSKVFKKVGTVTTPTRPAAELIQPYFEKQIIPISCGINLEIFNPRNNGNYLKEKYKISSSPILLYVGRLDKEKNIDMVLRALPEALKNTDLQFVIAGNGAEKESLMEISKKLNIEKNVVFTGFVPNEDLPNLYATAYCFIIAGTAELQSIVTMEAMASGLPVLGVNAVALPELVKDKQNGFLFNYGDIKSLSEKISLIFNDKNQRDNMSKKSLELIQDHDIKRSIKKFEDVYTIEINKK